MFLAEKLHEEVYYYQDVIPNPGEIVSFIEELDSKESLYPVIPKWKHWMSNSGDGYAFGGKKDFAPENLHQISEEDSKLISPVIDALRKGIRDVASAYFVDRGISGTPNISPFVGIGKYVTGCEMGSHFDAQAGDKTLRYSIVMYLNEDYEGGEISFSIRDYDLRQMEFSDRKPFSHVLDERNADLIDFWLKPKPGSALIFPSTHPFMHRVHMVTSGDKYIVPGFVFIDGYDPSNPEHRKQFNAGSINVDQSYSK